jgi:hypothetical protein
MLGQTHAINIASGSGRINCLSSVGVVAVQGKLEIAAACGLQALLLLYAMFYDCLLHAH